jgi:hypothetical protein
MERVTQVPYSRIKDCLIARWTGKTREQIVWDCDYLRAQFGLTKRKCDPALNRYNFHDYVNSIFQFVVSPKRLTHSWRIMSI